MTIAEWNLHEIEKMWSCEIWKLWDEKNSKWKNCELRKNPNEKKSPNKMIQMMWKKIWMCVIETLWMWRKNRNVCAMWKKIWRSPIQIRKNIISYPKKLIRHFNRKHLDRWIAHLSAKRSQLTLKNLSNSHFRQKTTTNNSVFQTNFL